MAKLCDTLRLVYALTLWTGYAVAAALYVAGRPEWNLPLAVAVGMTIMAVGVGTRRNKV